jgi:hypothetical protein
MVLGDAFGRPVPGLRALQLPAVAGEPWLGAELPEDAAPAGDRLSLVVADAAALDLDGGPSVGLLVDQWTEVIPSRDELTGVAVHYDQPDATPPQCLLLVVPPEPRRGWRLEDLVQTLHDTLELAKTRAVELEHVHGDVYGQLLPALLGELVPEAGDPGGGEIPGNRVILDFEAANPVPDDG